MEDALLPWRVGLAIWPLELALAARRMEAKAPTEIQGLGLGLLTWMRRDVRLRVKAPLALLKSVMQQIIYASRTSIRVHYTCPLVL